MPFGSDLPVPAPDQWLADFEKRDLKAGVRPLIRKEDAIRMLGLKS